MSPPTVTVRRAKGQPAVSPATDFAMCLVGTSSATPLAAGALSQPYGSGALLVADYGIGDGVDAACQALAVTDDNPQPPAISFLSTNGMAALIAGVRGTVTQTGTGTAVVTKRATTPQGTYEPKVRVADDGASGAGTAIGTAGIVLEASVNGGRSWLPTFALGVATSFTIKIPNPGGTDYDTGITYDFEPASTDKTALYTKMNLLRTALLAHFLIVSGGTPVHGAADSADNTALTAVATATTPATAVALFNAMLSRLGTHGASATYHTGADATLSTALALLSVAADVSDVELQLNALITAYNAHRVNVSSVHGSADGTNTVTAFTPVEGTLITGDAWTESKTTPPQWAIGDLYTAGSPAAGALITIASSSQNFGMVVLTEPIAAANVATLSAALDAMKAIKASCRPTLICRFRDQGAAESESTYLAALATFRAACADDARIHVVAGDGWLTDAFRSYVYSRSGLPALLARIQGQSAIPGVKGERVAQEPKWTARGPLVGFSVRDTASNPVGHDERLRPGALGPYAGKGGFGCFYYEGADGIAGTYYAGSPTLYGALPTVLTLPDNRLSSGIERVLYTVAFTFLGGAAIVTSGLLEQDACDGMASAAMAAIKDLYGNEFANPEDPNLVTVDPNVTVSGADISVTWYVRNRLFLYVNGITVVINNGRP